MSNERFSVYRDALQVPPERLAAMDDKDLNILMMQLLQAQAYRCGSPISEIRVNAESRAKDDGCDGWSAKPATSDDWLSTSDTCWQFKAGSAGEPARLAGEVLKPTPKETVINGGRFVLVASGSTNGKKGEEVRLSTLQAAAKAAGILTAPIEVIGSERLAIWCNQHPAVAARWAGRPEGLWTLEDWANSDEHRVPWQGSTPVRTELEARRADLDLAAGTIQHLHIQGPPGVGKTRFALELCRDASWHREVIYIRQAADIRLSQLIDGAAADPGVKLVIVADEVQPEQIRPLRDSVGRGDGRVRLITIGHSPTPDPSRIPSLLVKPLDTKSMAEVIKGSYPAMPREHIDFVVRFSAGFVRLARLAADAIARNPTLDVRDLLGRDEIRGFLDGMLGAGDRKSLHVVAVLTSVGWTEDKQVEGEAVARHFSLDWNAVRDSVEDFQRRLGIAPRSGRYRYISPTPLGIYLAVEAWTTFPDLLRSLPDKLPTGDALDAYYERLQSMASNPQARQYAREELAFFFRADDFVDFHAVRRWSALAAADPAGAAQNLLKALENSDLEARKRIEGRARREIVWALVRLAWKSSAFHDAVMALALLAEAENETWANNASAEFVARFQIFLGGSAVPYLRRLEVLDELVAMRRPALSRLVVSALALVGNRESSRMDSGHASDEVPEIEWRPRTDGEHFVCVESALKKLSDIARPRPAGLRADLIDAARNLSVMLRDSVLRGLVADFLESVRQAYPEAREPLRRIIANVLYGEKHYWKQLSTEELKSIEELHSGFEDHTLGARLQQYVGPTTLGRDEEPDLGPLAAELLQAPEVLAEYWPWLTSGEATEGWRLGQALAANDSAESLAETLPLVPGAGSDLRMLCAYVCAKRQSLGDRWYDEWMATQAARQPRPVALLVEMAWRCGVTDCSAAIVINLLRSEQVSDAILAPLGFGAWGGNVQTGILELVLRAMAETGHRDTAIGILWHRIKANPQETEHWTPLALQLITSSDLIRSHQMTSYYWSETAKTLVAEHAGELAAAILREQADRDSGTWFAEHSEAGAILLQCVNKDPSAVWQAMIPYLSSPAVAYRFIIGFPPGVLERMPPNEVGAWIAEMPEERAALIARLVDKDMSSDETLTARLLGEYGDNDRVASAFFSAFISGSWWGPASSHWSTLAEALDGIAERTSSAKLRRWAADHARYLREMTQQAVEREQEADLRGWQ